MAILLLQKILGSLFKADYKAIPKEPYIISEVGMPSVALYQTKLVRERH